MSGTSSPLSLIAQYESGNQNIYNYLYNSNPSLYTASGYYQITNSTWAQGAQLAGVDTSQYPTAISAPYDVQTQVAQALYNQYGYEPWEGNQQLMQAVAAQGAAAAEAPDMTTGADGIPTETITPSGNPLSGALAGAPAGGTTQISWLEELAIRGMMVLIGIVLIAGGIYMAGRRASSARTVGQLARAAA